MPKCQKCGILAFGISFPILGVNNEKWEFHKIYKFMRWNKNGALVGENSKTKVKKYRSVSDNHGKG
jgi:hypothetical protein